MNSKFEYSIFADGYFAVSKQKYTKEQAIEIFRHELGLDDPCIIAVGSAFVCYYRKYDDDGELYSGWWLESDERRWSCPVWVLSIDDGWRPIWPEDCELIEVG